MNITAILASFAHDKQVALVLLLIVADFILGVLAAFRAGTFRLTYIANFIHNDLLKVGLWLGVFAFDKASHAAGIVGPIDWNQANLVTFAILTAAMVGSILSSLADLGVSLPVPIAGHAPPQVVTPPVHPVRKA